MYASRLDLSMWDQLSGTRSARTSLRRLCLHEKTRARSLHIGVGIDEGQDGTRREAGQNQFR